MGVLAPAILKRSGLDILNRVLLEQEEGTLWLTATDLEVWVRVGIPNESDDFSGAILPSNLLVAAALARTLGEEIKIEKKNQVINFSIGGGRIQAEYLPGADYPQIEPAEVDVVEVAPSLLSAVGMVLPEVSRDMTRYILTGVYFDQKTIWHGHSGYLVGTNGIQLTAINHPDIPFDGVLPARAAEVLRNVSADSSIVQVEAGASDEDRRHAQFRVVTGWGEIQMSARLLRGGYPDWAGVMPESLPTAKSRWNSALMLPLLDAIAPVATAVVVDVADEKSCIQSESGEILVNDPPIKVLTGSSRSTCRITYLQRVCRLFPAGATVQRDTGKGPFVATGDDSTTTHIFMPMTSEETRG